MEDLERSIAAFQPCMLLYSSWDARPNFSTAFLKIDSSSIVSVEYSGGRRTEHKKNDIIARFGRCLHFLRIFFGLTDRSKYNWISVN